MVKFGKIPGRESPPPSPVNPYDPVTVFVGTQPVSGRPYEFDSEPVNQDARNAAGQLIRPVKAVTTCPNCGGGIDVDLRLGLSVGCESCGLGHEPAPPVLSDPFCNPVADGRISLIDLIADSAVSLDHIDLDEVRAIKFPNQERGSILDLGPEPD